MLKLINVSLRRGTRILFSNANLNAYPGQKWGVTGNNGTGKSSLFALISGEIELDEGEFSISKDSTYIAQVRQETPSSEKSAIEYVIDGDREFRALQQQIESADAQNQGERLAKLHEQLSNIDGFSISARAGRILHGLGFSFDEQNETVNSFSGGWRMRLNLAQALMTRSDTLLLDEPTNHLDLDAIVWLENWLAAYQGVLMLISHDREFLDQVVTHIAHIDNQSVSVSEGNYSAAERWRAEQLSLRQQAYAKQSREIAHMQKFIDRFRYKASKARQAQSRLKALERMQTVAPVHIRRSFSFVFETPDNIPNPMLKLEQLVAGYNDNIVLKNIDFSLHAGARIGLLGANGAGKSTFMKTLAGVLKTKQGLLETNNDLRIGYFAQHQLEQLDAEATPMNHMMQIAVSVEQQKLRTHLGKFGFSGESVNEPVAIRSGGEKARLVLALIVYQKPNLLLLDEPTNHLDIDMRHAITMALQTFEGSVVVVAHDRHLLRLVTDELWLVDGGNVTPFSGDLDEYVRWLHERQRKSLNSNVSEPKPESAKQIRQRKAAAREQLKPLRDQLKRLETELEKIEKNRIRLEEDLSDSQLYESENRAKLQAILQNQGQLANQQKQLEREWIDVSEKLEQASVS